jgi:hypothetical protein
MADLAIKISPSKIDDLSRETPIDTSSYTLATIATIATIAFDGHPLQRSSK